jgi:uncharacterized membrane protein
LFNNGENFLSLFIVLPLLNFIFFHYLFSKITTKKITVKEKNILRKRVATLEQRKPSQGQGSFVCTRSGYTKGIPCLPYFIFFSTEILTTTDFNERF